MPNNIPPTMHNDKNYYYGEGGVVGWGEVSVTAGGVYAFVSSTRKSRTFMIVRSIDTAHNGAHKESPRSKAVYM